MQNIYIRVHLNWTYAHQLCVTYLQSLYSLNDIVEKYNVYIYTYLYKTIHNVRSIYHCSKHVNVKKVSLNNINNDNRYNNDN